MTELMNPRHSHLERDGYKLINTFAVCFMEFTHANLSKQFAPLGKQLSISEIDYPPGPTICSANNNLVMKIYFQSFPHGSCQSYVIMSSIMSNLDLFPTWEDLP